MIFGRACRTILDFNSPSCVQKESFGVPKCQTALTAETLCHINKTNLSKTVNILNDWRYQNQDRYLSELKFEFLDYVSDPENDHDHCEFCGGKFSSVISGAFNEGWTDANQYRWICNKCFQDFEVELKLARK